MSDSSSSYELDQGEDVDAGGVVGAARGRGGRCGRPYARAAVVGAKRAGRGWHVAPT